MIHINHSFTCSAILLLLGIFVAQVQSEISYLRRIRPVINSSPASAYSYDSTKGSQYTIFMSNANNASLSSFCLLHFFFVPVFTNGIFSYSFLQRDLTNNYSYPVRTRTTEINGLNNLNNTFLLFTDLKLYLISKNFTATTKTILQYTAVSSNSIVQAMFLPNSSSQVMALVSNPSQNYTISYINTVNSNTVNITSPIGSNKRYIQHVKNAGFVWFLFDNSAYAFGPIPVTNGSTLGGYVTTISIPYICSQYRMDALANILVLSCDNHIFMHNISNITNPVYMKNITFDTPVQDIKLFWPFLIVSTNQHYIQYDLDLNLPISSFSNRTSGVRFDILFGHTSTGWGSSIDTNSISNSSTAILVTYMDEPNFMDNFTTLKFNQSYQPANTVCYQGYTYFDTGNGTGSCVKNFTYVYGQNSETNTSLNGTSNSSSVSNNSSGLQQNSTNNASTNLTNSSNGSNSSIPAPNTNNSLNSSNTTFVSPVPYAHSGKEMVQKQIEDWRIQPTIGRCLSFTPIPLLPKFSRCLVLLLDDLWYYKFHRVHYPETARSFMDNIDIINQFRFLPWDIIQILMGIQNQIQTEISIKDKIKYNQIVSYHENNPQSIYFFNSAQDIYINSFILNLGFFAIIKLIYLGLKIFRNKNKVVKQLFKFVAKNSKWWIVITMMIQSNLAKLTFTSSLQFLIPSCFSFSNKVNFVVANLSLLVTILYSLTFYPICYLFQSKKSAQTLLAHCKYSQSAFFLESFCFLSRNCIRSFIQAVFLQFYFYQISMLLMVDLVSIAFLLMFKRIYYNKYLFTILLLYNTFFFALDLAFLLRARFPNIWGYFDYDLFLNVIIWIIIGIFILSILFLASYSVYQLINKLMATKKQAQKKLAKKNNNKLQMPNFNHNSKQLALYQKANKKNPIIAIFEKKKDKQNLNCSSQKTVQNIKKNQMGQIKSCLYIVVQSVDRKKVKKKRENTANLNPKVTMKVKKTKTEQAQQPIITNI